MIICLIYLQFYSRLVNLKLEDLVLSFPIVIETVLLLLPVLIIIFLLDITGIEREFNCNQNESNEMLNDDR